MFKPKTSKDSTLCSDDCTRLEGISKVQVVCTCFYQSPFRHHVHAQSIPFSHSCLEVLGPFGSPLQVHTAPSRNMGEPLALISKVTLLKVLVAQWTNHNSNCYIKTTELQAFHIWFQLCLLLFLLLSLRLNFSHGNKVSFFFHGSFLCSQSMLPWKNHRADWDGRRGYGSSPSKNAL